MPEIPVEKLDPRHTALVLIDLQKGIVPFAGGPHTGAEVLEKAGTLIRRFHDLGSPVVLVRVGWSADGGDALRLPVDQPSPARDLPADWWEFPDELGAIDSDIRVTKRQWGAFYGTELELQLRRRGIEHIVLGGISTNIGVESTARNAWELGFGIVFAEDTMSAASGEHHAFAVKNIFPRLGRVRSTAQVLDMLG
ncbi:putative isochorismatase family protein YecD [Dyella nitratireducens]|uniref:Isochorismatase family protein YecD n=1 Tax=Dyella nitratireducens TaxID=1849580 RepID=A0ABQ1FS49_9GAMM|nr:putative isochorismatase family protein YecD [Dyella nitratireducens]GLQ43310.1 isochorismatase family protein YecD [Dyella nitratireducens]